MELRTKYLHFGNYITVQEEKIPYTDTVIIKPYSNIDENEIKYHLINKGYSYLGFSWNGETTDE